MKTIATAENGTVLLDSGLDEMMFGKAKFSRHLTDRGLLYDEATRSFTPWGFDGTRTAGGEVFFCGSGFTGKPAAAVTESGGERGRKEILYRICAAYTEAGRQGAAVPVVSPAGILCNDGGLLFLPEAAFDRSCANLGGRAYTEMQGCWRDSALTGAEAVSFARAVLAYYALTGSLPYPPPAEEQNTAADRQNAAAQEKNAPAQEKNAARTARKRRAGAADDGQGAKLCFRDFLPLEFCVNGVNAHLARAVNAPLAETDFPPHGEADAPFPLEALRAELADNPARETAVPEAEFRARAEAFRQRQRRKVRRKIRLRRCRAFAVAAAAVCAVGLSVFMESRGKPTVIGLSSEETAEVFYCGVHNTDTELVLAAARHCPQAQSCVSRISQIFVTAKMQSAYDLNAGLSTPENWLFFEPASVKADRHMIYGITNFTLNGKPSTLKHGAPQKKSHPPRLTRENGVPLTPASGAVCVAEYYFVRSADGDCEIEKCSDIITLGWKKNRWQITGLERTAEAQAVSLASFSENYRAALEKSGGNIRDAVASLRPQYPWLPAEAALLEEERELAGQGF